MAHLIFEHELPKSRSVCIYLETTSGVKTQTSKIDQPPRAQRLRGDPCRQIVGCLSLKVRDQELYFEPSTLFYTAEESRRDATLSQSFAYMIVAQGIRCDDRRKRHTLIRAVLP